MVLINLTPHPIVVVGDSGETLRVIPASGMIARLKTTTERCGSVDGVPLSRTVFGEPEGLPDPEDGTLYIVSQLIKSALPQRADLVVPAEVVRDQAGNIIGCKSLGL